MGFPHRRAAIVGVYTTEMAKAIDRSSFSLQLEAIQGALADAGLTVKDVDGLCTAVFSDHLNPDPGNTTTAHQFWAEQLGGRPLSLVVHGGGSAHLPKAAAAVSAGLADVVVYFYGKGSKQAGVPWAMPPTDKAPRVPEWSYLQAGLSMNSWYALWARRYMHDFGATSADLAEVAVFTRHHATLNPDSLMGSRGDITVEDVLTSRPIAEPLHLLDCAPVNDGAFAVVVASEDIARNCRHKPIWVLGAGEAYHTDFYASVHEPWFPEDGQSVRAAARRAFGMAGVTRDDIDVAGLYDCYTITTLRNLEEMGFCKLGEAAAFVKEGNCSIGGSLPTNTDGGLLSNSHTGDPAGMPTIEVVRQLRGGCGERQVDGAEVGVSLAQGWAVHGVGSVLVLGKD
jgi:acetyl-CoA acetyltransferase